MNSTGKDNSNEERDTDTTIYNISTSRITSLTQDNGIEYETNQQPVYSIPSSLLTSTDNNFLTAAAFTPRLYRDGSIEPSEVSSLLHREKPNMTVNMGFKILENRSIIVDILAILFGIGTWVGINGTFIQLPLLVEVAPEGWSLPSYLSVMVQIGNLGPLTYTLIQKFCKKNDAPMIYILLATGTLSAILTAFFYDKTAKIFGEQHSVALFALTISTAFTACTSSVLFMPYMGRFKEIYLVTYFMGEGLSGLLPSVVALIQGIGGTAECILVNVTETGENVYEKYVPPPRFGTKDFFIFVFVVMLMSCLGFTLLDRLKLAKKQYAAVKVGQGNDYQYERDETPTKSTSPEVIENKSVDTNSNENKTSDLAPVISSQVYVSLLMLIAVVCFFANGIFNSIQSYSCLPYGGQAYHLSATLSVIANPVACFLAIFLPHTSVRSILTLTSLAGILAVYVFVTAAMSPFPPLHGTTIGSVLVIITWTLLVGLVSYIKLSISTVMRSQGGKSLVWTGGLSQLGSLIGSVLIFLLINYTNSFTAAYDDC
ncbi:solute carrier family 52, riboflavin transporter, member 3-A isoform X2 [Stomoxys calcitrans]|nr:solute carrier family 52, riboflavin transporter, member 3-A isoform X2 [Stomoxys calcitrans]XP_013097513.1 solute carrier family 52, riboflavin transporter, member 3-A isoform X2 [Stomoxys calcitrans]